MKMTQEQKAKVCKRMIVVMFCILIACYLLFIFGSKMFTVAAEGETALAIDTFILSNDWFIWLIATMTKFIYFYLIYCIVFQKWRMKWYLTLGLFAVVAASNAVAVFAGLSLEGIKLYYLLEELALHVLAPILIGRFIYKIKLETILLTSIGLYLAYIGYNTLSMDIKDVAGLSMITSPVIALILTIDVYIALGIGYLYSNYIKRREQK